MKEDFFSISRFRQYFRQSVAESWKPLVQLGGSIVGVLVLVAVIFPYIFGAYNAPYTGRIDKMWGVETGCFTVVCPLLVVVAASMMFSSLSGTARRISVLTLPASTLEKFIAHFLIYGVCIYFLLVAGIFVADWLRVLTAPAYAADGAIIKPLSMRYLCSFSMIEPGQDVITSTARGVAAMRSLYIGSVIVSQSVFVLASVIWPRRALIKGILAVVGIMMTMVLLMVMSASMGFSFPVSPFAAGPGVVLDADCGVTLTYLVSVVMAAGILCLAYMRFKEIETIDRW